MSCDRKQKGTERSRWMERSAMSEPCCEAHGTAGSAQGFKGTHREATPGSTQPAWLACQPQGPPLSPHTNGVNSLHTHPPSSTTLADSRSKVAPERTTNLSPVFWGLQEEGVDQGNRIRLDLLVGAAGTQKTQQRMALSRKRGKAAAVDSNPEPALLPCTQGMVQGAPEILPGNWPLPV